MGRSLYQWPFKQKSWITKNKSDKGWAVRIKPYIIVEEISPERGVRGLERKITLSLWKNFQLYISEYHGNIILVLVIH